MDHFENYRQELREIGLSTKEDLAKLVVPLVREAVKFSPVPATAPAEKSLLLSHFGGQPYFEKGEAWPSTDSGQPLDFIFQVVNTSDINLPGEIKLLQFYYDWESSPWDTADEGWLVKSYREIVPAKAMTVQRPQQLDKRPYCEILFQKIKMLPDWEGISEYDDRALKLSCILDQEAALGKLSHRRRSTDWDD